MDWIWYDIRFLECDSNQQQQEAEHEKKNNNKKQKLIGSNSVDALNNSSRSDSDRTIRRVLFFSLFFSFFAGPIFRFFVSYRVLPSFTEFYRVLPSFTEFYRVISEYPGGVSIPNLVSVGLDEKE